MKCPKCGSEEVEYIDAFPTLDYAEHGEFYAKYKCSKCGFEFQELSCAEEPMFGEEV